MRWLNPVAFIGLLALAIPILVHLFGRRVARLQRFPTLRLLRDAHPTPATRSRPSDLLLLALRCAVILAAVLGLAQPQWSTAERSRASLVPVRAIIVDTSASMRRLTSDGSSALERARARGQQMLDSAREGMIVETGQPGASMAGAASWLAGRSGLRELVVISDFQAGAVFEGNLASIDSGVGVTFERVVLTDSDSTRGSPVRLGDLVTLEAQPNRTVATWSTPALDTALSIDILAGDAEEGAVRASLAAARALAPASRASRHRVAVVFPGYSGRRALVDGSAALDSSWQGDLLIALERNEVLSAVGASAIVTSACDSRGVAVAHTARGEVIATMAKSPPGSEHDILVFACVEPGSLAGAALLAGTISALDPVSGLQELEPEFVPDETLRQWEQPSTDVAPRGREDTSPDGRWFWIAALALLLVEEVLRRRSPDKRLPAITEVPRERVA